MACSPSKFILNRNASNEFVITIKQSGTVLPMVIGVSDTFTATLIDLETDTLVPILITTSVVDGTNGKIKVVFDQNVVNTFTVSKGSKVDKYYLKPSYKLVIACDTATNGKFVAKFPEVYVE